MKKSEIEKSYPNVVKDGKTFTPRYYYNQSNIQEIKDSNGETIDYEYSDFVLEATAEEAYQESLKPLTPQPTPEEKLRADIEYLSAMTGVAL